MSSITFEAALEMLVSMFPSYERETLVMLLAANNNNVERTIESVLVMDGTLDAVGSDSLPPLPPSSSSSSAGVPAPPSSSSSSSRPGSRGDDFNQFGDMYGGEFSRNPRSAGAKTNGAAGSTSSSGSAAASQQVRRVVLPDDFLRPPGWRENNFTMGDEQLALMLQNELFRAEARQMLGRSYPQQQHPQGQQHQHQQQGQQGQQGGGGGGGHSQEGIPDMGILKGLSSMSEQARRSLSQLAMRFQQSNGSSGGGNGTGSHSSSNGGSSSSSSSSSSSQYAGLLGHADEEDDEEVISFPSNISRGTGARHTLDDLGAGSRESNRLSLGANLSSSSSSGGGGGKKDA